MISDSSKNLSLAGPIVEEIKGMLKSFDDHKIKWVRTEEINKLSCAYYGEGGC